jgi:hypothetical protein
MNNNLRHNLNNINLSTLLGLTIAKFLGGKTIQLDSKLYINYGRSGKYIKYKAITIGDVILARKELKTSLINHELKHSIQFAYLGILFFPIYALFSLYSYYKYSNTWQGNIFEINAGLEDGEYI